MKMNIKNKLSNLAWSRLRNRGLLVAVGVAALLAAACADDDLATDKSNKQVGTALAFNVSDVQMDALAQNATEQTRGLSMQPIPASYLAPRKIEATGSNPHDFCLIESTVEGINPVKADSKTRGTILTAGTLGTFSSIGYRAASPTAASNPNTALLWFHGEKTNPDGTLVNRYDWDWPVNVYGRFYAVYPEATPANKITLSPSNYAQVPYVDFEVNPDVKQQKDLMTACSGEVHYIHGNDPTSNLKFRHALAAVKFSIGSNLSPITITKIELTNVKYKGRYRLPNKADGSDATWTSVDNATTTMMLDNININAAEMPNTMLAGALDPDPNNHNRAGRENYTFLMIPQTMPAKTATNAIKAVIHYQDGATTKTITIPLTGEWKAGVTKEYKLSQKSSSWGYHFTLTGNENDKTFSHDANYTGATNTQFQVTSYRQSGTTQQPVPWKISKYEEWDYTLNGGTGGWVDRGTTKPAWLGDITDHGNGGTVAEVGNTAVKVASVTDQLATYNQTLKDATPKGTAASPYNLANPGGNGAKNHIEETANCYLISAPGHYCIPLVYGNGVKNDVPNTNAYQSTQPAGTPYLLKFFKDHQDGNITNPYIGGQLGGSAHTANVVWLDQPNLIRNASLRITYDGPNFVEFEVKKEDIRNGNAVIAIKRGGQIVWSWHLWFDHADALDLIPVKNHDGVEYKFTRNTLGTVLTKYEATAYDKPRKVRVTIEQQAGNGGNKESSKVTIVQNPKFGQREDIATLYQFGRKDALPGTVTFYDGSSSTPSTTAFTFIANASRQSIGTIIRNPDKMYAISTHPQEFYNQIYANTWAANNTSMSNYSDNDVVKTIYDPCPAGFHVPNAKAFTGFVTTGNSSTNPSEINAEGSFSKGYNFKTNIGSSTIFFPAAGYRHGSAGTLNNVGNFGEFYSAFPASNEGGVTMFLSSFGVGPQYAVGRAFACAVRPVADN